MLEYEKALTDEFERLWRKGVGCDVAAGRAASRLRTRHAKMSELRDFKRHFERFATTDGFGGDGR